MPDYPRMVKAGELGYFPALWSIVTILVRNPVLVQCCLCGMLTSTLFTCESIVQCFDIQTDIVQPTGQP
jgi:hypothetical protein